MFIFHYNIEEFNDETIRNKKMRKFTELIVWLFATLLCAQQNVNYDESKISAYTLPEVLQCENEE